MDSRVFIEKLKGHKEILGKVAKVAGVFLALAVVFSTAPSWSKKMKSFLHSPAGRYTRELIATYTHAFESVQVKMVAISRAEQENERLRLENANLRLLSESTAFECRSKNAESRTHAAEFKLTKETGAKAGRSLAAIEYRPPHHLAPAQLYTLGVSYFKAREDEKSAVILTFLTGLEENATFKTPKNYLMTGVSWYRLENFELAEAYFQKVLEAGESSESAAYAAQARLWLGLLAEKTGHHVQAQSLLRQLVDHHPHSTEAEWVNSREVRRAPSSESAEDDDEE